MVARAHMYAQLLFRIDAIPLSLSLSLYRRVLLMMYAYVSQVIRQVHPDRFARWPEQRAQNADALKRLNAFVDTVRHRGRVSPLLLRFFVVSFLENRCLLHPRCGSPTMCLAATLPVQ